MDKSSNIIIVGNGVAGVTAARLIKEKSPKTNVDVYTDEPHNYYPRPRLYEVMSGQAQPQDVYLFSEQWYKTKGINVHLNKKVTEIKTKQKQILLDDQTTAKYDKLLLANGAHPFIPPIKGVETKGVYTLRYMQDALTIKEYAKTTKKAVVIGGGLLGLEFAYCLRKLGQHVTVLEMHQRLLPRQLDQDGATILKSKIESTGINVVLDAKTAEIQGKKTGTEILLDNNQTISGDLVLLSAGIRPNTNLASTSGIKVNKGVIVNNHLQTSANDVYAAGDIAEFESKIYGIIPAAIQQANIAATNMLTTQQINYEGTIPSNTLKIVGIDLTSIGNVNPDDKKLEELKKADPKKGIYKKLVLDNGVIVGAIFLGTTKGVTSITNLINQKTDITKYKKTILDEDFDYKKVASLT
ncbi:MAG: FAD-dependent oxidoreductase [Candidatus Bathyarchaeota archaeon]|nr:FAD-dependent oxidoreductase [Candidatus Bathyarchaeota archaeon]